jgi:hypothetical protein
MTDVSPRRPPYLIALAVIVLVFVGYALTLAPTVTFWDAGELIAAVHTLGIPHPPGTPLFVMLGHVWSKLVPLGEVAFRLNLMSAFFSAMGAGLFFLVAHQTLAQQMADLPKAMGRLLALGGAAAAAVIGAFTFTVWQNSNETEVYSVATFSIACMCWAAHMWREERPNPRAARWLLFIVYLGGVSMGNHLLALLAGPAIIMFAGYTVWRNPQPDPTRRRTEWAQVAVLAGVWALMIGTGLGSTTLVIVGGLCFVAAAVFAAGAHALSFAVITLAIASIGVTTYLFLYIRAGQGPVLNEADPSTWESLLAVIRRAQYPVRTPFDDPTVAHGPGNPGRSLTIMKLQLLNYIQYFDWQWAQSVAGRLFQVFPLRTIATLVFFGLGLKGLVDQRRTDRAAWWMLFVLWVMTGLGLMAYMNFKPGFSLGYDLFPGIDQHEVRERDYFFLVSFAVWGLWAGMGLAGIGKFLVQRWHGAGARIAAVAMLGLALVPVVGNARAASRRHGADAHLAADFAYNLLNSVPPYGIIFTYGDNDTFPLWWAQEVESIRRDVTVVCIALSHTTWYTRQVRDNPIRPFDPSTAPAMWREGEWDAPTWPVHTMTDAEIAEAAPGTLLPRDVEIPLGPIRTLIPARTPLYLADVTLLRVLQQNLGRRPVAWSITAGTNFYGLNRNLVQQGLVRRVRPVPVDSVSMMLPVGLQGIALDPEITERLAWDTYRYGELLSLGPAGLEPTGQSFAASLAEPFVQLAFAYQDGGNIPETFKNLDRASRLSPNPALRTALEQMRTELLQGGDPPPADSAGD